MRKFSHCQNSKTGCFGAIFTVTILGFSTPDSGGLSTRPRVRFQLLHLQRHTLSPPNQTMSSSSSAVMFQNLPELSLLSLFHSLPLHYLLHIDEVCSDWVRLKTEALRERKELIIVKDKSDLNELKHPNNRFYHKIYDIMLCNMKNEKDGSPYHKLIVCLDQHALYTKSISPVMFDQITKLLPKLKVLRISRSNCSFSELEQVTQLLTFYRYQLVEVTIIFCLHNKKQIWKNSDHNSEFTMFFSALNNMTVLTNLKLCLGLSQFSYKYDFDLTALSRLKTFNLGCGFDKENVFNQLKQYAEGNEQFEVLHSQFGMYVNEAISFGPRVSSAMKSVEIYEKLFLTRNFDMFKRFAQQCVNLQFLQIELADVSIFQLTETLALSCKKIVFLFVSVKYNDELAISVLENNQPMDMLPVLPSVKVLR